MLASSLRVARKRLKRLPMHIAIRGLVDWEPLKAPEEGYTVVIGCMRALAPFAVANVRLIERMDQQHMRELLLVFDCTEAELPDSVREAVRSWKGQARLRVLCYDDRQARAARRIQWGWVYSWMSWCKGIGAATTRHVLLHDLDALPADPDLFRSLYERAAASEAQFQGIRLYQGQGIEPAMNLVTTFELVLDAQYMRQNFKPFEGFNRACLIDGRYVDFDTFLYMQHKSPTRVVEPVDESRLVHPSQMICQYTDFMAGRDPMSATRHNLLLVPYFFLVGAEPGMLGEVGAALARPEARSVPFGGRELPVTHLSPEHWAWMEKQVRRMEQELHGATRPEVEAYLTGFIPRAGDKRTVGHEGERGVAER